MVAPETKPSARSDTTRKEKPRRTIAPSREILALVKMSVRQSSYFLRAPPRGMVEIGSVAMGICCVHSLCGSCGELVGKLRMKCA